MKKLFVLIFAIILAISFSACGGGDLPSDSNPSVSEDDTGNNKTNQNEPTQPTEDKNVLFPFEPPVGDKEAVSFTILEKLDRSWYYLPDKEPSVYGRREYSFEFSLSEKIMRWNIGYIDSENINTYKGNFDFKENGIVTANLTDDIRNSSVNITLYVEYIKDNTWKFGENNILVITIQSCDDGKYADMVGLAIPYESEPNWGYKPEDENGKPTDNNNIDWQTALENFLTQFPSLYDFGNPNAPDADGIYLPSKCRFQDLDGDGIPEVMITFGHPEGEWVFDKAYKLYDGSYEQIGQAMFIFYTNADGKLVVATKSGYTINAIYFAEIQDKKLILSDYIDSKENDNFNGVKYDSFSEEEGTSFFEATDADETLKLLPEIDCSNIFNAAKNRVYE